MDRLIVSIALSLAVSTAHAAEPVRAPYNTTLDSVTCNSIVWAISDCDAKIQEGCPLRSSVMSCMSYMANIAENRQRLVELWFQGKCDRWPK